MCDCEDRPACGHLAESGYYSSYDETDYEGMRDDAEARQLQWESYLDNPCEVCGEFFDADEDEEKDIIQGFHSKCASGSSGNENDWPAVEGGLFGDA